MGIQQYQSVSKMGPTSERDTNVLFINRLLQSLEIWKDTSLKKVDRTKELMRASEIIDVFITYFNDNMDEEAKRILLAIFFGISRKITDALSGDPVNFDDAIAALRLIRTTLKG